MKDVLGNLSDIEEWIDNTPDPATFRNDHDFMVFSVELMRRCLYILKVGASLAPSEEIAQKGYSKHKAIVVGHLVRIAKLYEGALMHVCERQLELAAIFSRLIFETAVRMQYLMQSKPKSKTFRSFILASYRPEKEMLADLDEKARARPLFKIEERIRRIVKAGLKHDGLSPSELMKNKTWNLDGKDFRRLLADLGKELAYSYVFGTGSHYVHGDWHELRLYHLQREGRYYRPKLGFNDPDPRLACPLTEECLDTLRP